MRFKVQVAEKTPTWVGSPWRTIRSFANQATAERVAQNIRTDGERTRVLASYRDPNGDGERVHVVSGERNTPISVPARINPVDAYRIQRDKLVTALIQISNDPDNALRTALAALEAQGITREVGG